MKEIKLSLQSTLKAEKCKKKILSSIIIKAKSFCHCTQLHWRIKFSFLLHTESRNASEEPPS